MSPLRENLGPVPVAAQWPMVPTLTRRNRAASSLERISPVGVESLFVPLMLPPLAAATIHEELRSANAGTNARNRTASPTVAANRGRWLAFICTLQNVASMGCFPLPPRTLGRDPIQK
jgi:hypothetical protein